MPNERCSARGGGVWAACLWVGAMACPMAMGSVGGATFTGLGFLPGGTESAAYGISADGTTVIGQSRPASVDIGMKWTASGGMQSLGDSNGGALACSADGSVICGLTQDAYGYRWTQAGGTQVLPPAPGYAHSGGATGISADGTSL